MYVPTPTATPTATPTQAPTATPEPTYEFDTELSYNSDLSTQTLVALQGYLSTANSALDSTFNVIFNRISSTSYDSLNILSGCSMPDDFYGCISVT